MVPIYDDAFLFFLFFLNFFFFVYKKLILNLEGGGVFCRAALQKQCLAQGTWARGLPKVDVSFDFPPPGIYMPRQSTVFS